MQQLRDRKGGRSMQRDGTVRGTKTCSAKVVAGLALLALLSLAPAATRAEDYGDTPSPPDSVWEWPRQFRWLFSSGPTAYQYSFELQRVVGSLPLTEALVGPWQSSAPAGPAVLVLPQWVNYSQHHYDCSLNWPLTNRLYHFVSDYYLRLRQDTTHSGGDLIVNGWTGIPNHLDACISFNFTHSFFFFEEYVWVYSNVQDSVTGRGKRADLFPALPDKPTAAFTHPHADWHMFFKDERVWAWDNAAQSVVPGYPQRRRQVDAQCTGVRYHTAPVAYLHDGSAFANGTDYAYADGLTCEWSFRPPKWQSDDLYNGMSVIFHQFDLRVGTSDVLMVYVLDNSTGLLQSWANYTAAHRPPLEQVVSLPSSAREMRLRFVTASDNGTLPVPAPAQGWNLTYYLRSPRSPATGDLVLSDIGERFHFAVPNVASGGGSQVQRAVIRPASAAVVPINTRYDFELLSFPDTDPTRGAEAKLEIFDVDGNLIRTCTGAATILRHCAGTFVGEITIVFISQVQAHGGLAVVVGRIDVEVTCAGLQTITGLNGTITDGSGDYAYSDNQLCQWLLLPGDELLREQIAIAMQVTALNTEPSDVFRVLDGANASAPVLQRYSGELTKGEVYPVVYSSPRALFAEFKSDGTFIGLGFSANWTRVFAPHPQHTVLAGLDELVTVAAIDPATDTTNVWGAVDGQRVLPRGVSSVLNITMRDYKGRPVSFEWGLVVWTLRFVPESLFDNLTAIAAAPSLVRETLSGDVQGFSSEQILDACAGVSRVFTWPQVVEYSTAAAPKDGDHLAFTTPLTAGRYAVLLSAVILNPSPAAPTVLPFNDVAQWIAYVTDGTRAVAYTQPTALLPTFVTLAIVLGVCSLVMGAAVLWYWNHNIVRAASPRFIVGMLAFSLTGYATAPTLIAYPPTVGTCSATLVLGHASFVAMFSAVFVKMYRIKEIYDVERKLMRHTLSDQTLLCRYLLPTFGILVVYLAIWFGVDPPQPVRFEASHDAPGLVYVECLSDYTVFPNLLVAIEGVMLLYGVYLAYVSRNVQWMFNESRWVGFSIYNFVVLGLLVLALQKGSVLDAPARLVLLAIAILFGCATTVSFVVLPRLFLVHTVEGKRLGVVEPRKKSPVQPAPSPAAATLPGTVGTGGTGATGATAGQTPGGTLGSTGSPNVRTGDATLIANTGRGSVPNNAWGGLQLQAQQPQGGGGQRSQISTMNTHTQTQTTTIVGADAVSPGHRWEGGQPAAPLQLDSVSARAPGPSMISRGPAPTHGGGGGSMDLTAAGSMRMAGMPPAPMNSTTAALGHYKPASSLLAAPSPRTQTNPNAGLGTGTSSRQTTVSPRNVVTVAAEANTRPESRMAFGHGNGHGNGNGNGQFNFAQRARTPPSAAVPTGDYGATGPQQSLASFSDPSAPLESIAMTALNTRAPPSFGAPSHMSALDRTGSHDLPLGLAGPGASGSGGNNSHVLNPHAQLYDTPSGDSHTHSREAGTFPPGGLSAAAMAAQASATTSASISEAVGTTAAATAATAATAGSAAPTSVAFNPYANAFPPRPEGLPPLPGVMSHMPPMMSGAVNPFVVPPLAPTAGGAAVSGTGGGAGASSSSAPSQASHGSQAGVNPWSSAAAPRAASGDSVPSTTSVSVR